MKVNRCFGGTSRLHLEGRRINRARNLHEAGSKQNIQQTTRRYIQEDVTIHNHRCENLKSYNNNQVSGSVNLGIYLPV
jgi:hypothetical protein